MDVSKSQAFHKHDQVMIHAEIQKTIGFTKMNEMVQTRMMQWLMEMARVELHALAEASTPKARRVALTDKPKYLKLKENLARMMRESGNVGEAEQFFVELYADLETHLGREHAMTLSGLNQLAVTVQKSGRITEAKQINKYIVNNDLLYKIDQQCQNTFELLETLEHNLDFPFLFFLFLI